MNLQTLTIQYFDYLDRKGKLFNISVGIICTLLLGGLDYYLDFVSGSNFALDFFYLIPISFVAWFSGRDHGIAISLGCSVTKFLATPATNYPLYLTIWKNFTVLAFFLVIAVLIAKMRQMLDHERTLSRTDHLTGAANSRAFLENMNNEISRQRRHHHPLTLSYLDIDDFKNINDNFGHNSGDAVLQTVVTAISQNLRRTDIVARLGGDEFAILFPDTGEEAALGAINKIREQLQLNMNQLKTPVTFSIGMVTCIDPPRSADEVLTLADDLMYEVKKNGKNSVMHTVYADKM